MGACRFLNVLLGMSLAPYAWTAPNRLIAIAIGTYVMGVTWIARSEARQSQRGPLVLGTAIMLGGMGLLSRLPAYQSITISDGRWDLFWIFFGMLIGWRCLRAILVPTPAMVQTAVRNAIHALIVLDAAICLAICGLFWGVVVLLLLVPTLAVGRWVYST
jgi:4-hydroxybenzoate polyprenyltransferase